MGLILENFHFLRPLAFLLLIPLSLLLYRLMKIRDPLAAWKKICDPELLAYLKVGGTSVPTSLKPLWLLGISALLAIIALAGPVWKQLPQPLYREQSGLVIILDVSRSMDASDLKPSRLVRAKQKVIDILSLRTEGESALLVFAGTAFVVTPLTEDHQTILAQLRGITTDIMPKQGGDIDAALEKAMLLFRQSSVEAGQVLLLTDSDDFSVDQVKQLAEAGHRLSVIGIGTEEGAPIKNISGGFLTDQDHNIVMAKLDEQRLRSLASLGKGSYSPLTLNHWDIQSALRMHGVGEKHRQESNQGSDVWQEEGSWLLLLLIPLALMGFRRGVLVVALLFSVQPMLSEAAIWDDWWQTKHQQAQVLMEKKHYALAAERFANPAWQATAAYRNQDYAAALQALERIEQPTIDDMYNKGNVLAHLGHLSEAIQMYDDVLYRQPAHDDARANKFLLEELKEEQEQGGKQQQSPEQGEQGASKAQPQTSDSEQEQGEQQQGEQSAQQNSAEEGDNKDKGNAEDEAKQSHERAASQQDENQEQSLDVEKVAVEKTEMTQAFEQQLRRIPDDPAGLLRRKFLYQYQQQGTAVQKSGEQLW